MKRIGIKIGSNLLIDPETGGVRQDWLRTLAADVAILHNAGSDVFIVTSGAIGLGWRVLNLESRPSKLAEKQACAAAGQIALLNAYQACLGAHGVPIGQVLLTYADTEARGHYLNARATMAQMFKYRMVPVINENDTTATAEIRFGDNDRLAARVAQMVEADTLILLSDIDGVYTANPKTNPDAQHLPEIKALTREILDMAGAPLAGDSTGGMVSKLEAARICMHAGTQMYIGNGLNPHAVAGILDKSHKSTVFLPETGTKTAWKRWLTGTLKVRGIAHIDLGAAAALRAGKSLLPVGVVRLEGQFDKGDVLQIVDSNGMEIARGLSNYDSLEAAQLIGKRAEDIKHLLEGNHATLVHRNNLVVHDV